MCRFHAELRCIGVRSIFFWIIWQRASDSGPLSLFFEAAIPAMTGLVVDHVHNDYVRGARDDGDAGRSLWHRVFCASVHRGAKIVRGRTGHFSTTLHAGAIAAVYRILLHSFVDFNLDIPSNALLFPLQAYLATSSPLPSGNAMPHRRIRTREHALAIDEQ